MFLSLYIAFCVVCSSFLCIFEEVHILIYVNLNIHIARCTFFFFFQIISENLESSAYISLPRHSSSSILL
ncbi:unnamed protein product, partial [Candidula unifasciata]